MLKISREFSLSFTEWAPEYNENSLFLVKKKKRKLRRIINNEEMNTSWPINSVRVNKS